MTTRHIWLNGADTTGNTLVAFLAAAGQRFQPHRAWSARLLLNDLGSSFAGGTLIAVDHDPARIEQLAWAVVEQPNRFLTAHNNLILITARTHLPQLTQDVCDAADLTLVADDFANAIRAPQSTHQDPTHAAR